MKLANCFDSTSRVYMGLQPTFAVVAELSHWPSSTCLAFMTQTCALLTHSIHWGHKLCLEFCLDLAISLSLQLIQTPDKRPWPRLPWLHWQKCWKYSHFVITIHLILPRCFQYAGEVSCRSEVDWRGAVVQWLGL